MPGGLAAAVQPENTVPVKMPDGSVQYINEKDFSTYMQQMAVFDQDSGMWVMKPSGLGNFFDTAFELLFETWTELPTTQRLSV